MLFLNQPQTPWIVLVLFLDLYACLSPRKYRMPQYDPYYLDYLGYRPGSGIKIYFINGHHQRLMIKYLFRCVQTFQTKIFNYEFLPGKTFWMIHPRGLLRSLGGSRPPVHHIPRVDYLWKWITALFDFWINFISDSCLYHISGGIIWNSSLMFKLIKCNLLGQGFQMPHYVFF